MSLLNQQQGTETEARPLSVGEVTTWIRKILEPTLANVWVRGEICNLRPASSGHLYFSLKDSDALLSCAFFGWGRKSGAIPLKEGLEVLVHGKISVYPPRGSYQLVLDQIHPLGAGALQLQFEAMKQRLAQAGLFEAARKRPIPKFPKKIAVVTSPTGAAIQDFLSVLQRRAPQAQVTIIPALVQGDAAVAQLVRAVQAANRLNLADVLVVTRGGGSLEDLWCFNSEELVHALAASKIPTVSAVGHEIDFTLADFVADLRAPTPSAAAEMLSAGWLEAPMRLDEHQARLLQSMDRFLERKNRQLDQGASQLRSPAAKLLEWQTRLNESRARLMMAIPATLERRRLGLQNLMGRLDAVSPLRVLERGYTLIQDVGSGKLLRAAEDVQTGLEANVRFHDGSRRARFL